MTTSRSPLTSRRLLQRCSGILPCNELPSPDTPRHVLNASVVLTDSNDAALAAAVERLDGWRLEQRPSTELPGTIGTVAGTRVVFTSTSDPTLLRAIIEKAHAAG